MTVYQVLRKEDDVFRPFARVEANSTETAIRQAATKEKQAGEYVAVPVRSFQVVKVVLESVPRAVISAKANA